jgi:hypothetical protein
MKQKDKSTFKKNEEISIEQLQEEIRKLAHQIFLERGDAVGEALSDWLQAEKEIKKKYNLE